MKFTPMPHHIFLFLTRCAIAQYGRRINSKNNQVDINHRLDRFFYARVSGYRKPLSRTNHNSIGGVTA